MFYGHVPVSFLSWLEPTYNLFYHQVCDNQTNTVNEVIHRGEEILLHLHICPICSCFPPGHTCYMRKMGSGCVLHAKWKNSTVYIIFIFNESVVGSIRLMCTKLIVVLVSVSWKKNNFGASSTSTTSMETINHGQ